MTRAARGARLTAHPHPARSPAYRPPGSTRGRPSQPGPVMQLALRLPPAISRPVPAPTAGDPSIDSEYLYTKIRFSTPAHVGLRVFCAYCKKCRVNLGSKSSGWPNVPVLIESSWIYMLQAAVCGVLHVNCKFGRPLNFTNTSPYY